MALLFWLRGQRAFPVTSVEPSIIQDAIVAGEGTPSPMLSIAGLKFEGTPTPLQHDSDNKVTCRNDLPTLRM